MRKLPPTAAGQHSSGQFATDATQARVDWRLSRPVGRRQIAPSSWDEQFTRRVILSVAVGCVAAAMPWTHGATLLEASDFAQLWHAARALLGGGNPYAAVGPGRSFDWPFPLLYPLPAVLLAALVVPFPLHIACALFLGLGMAALSWTLSRDRSDSACWWLLASPAFVGVIVSVQWSALLIAAARIPSLGFVLACKPSVGLAMLAAYPSARAIVLATTFGMTSLAVQPGWWSDWFAALPAATHMTAPVTYVSAGGPIVLLALLQWRQPAARLLVALACIPHTTMPYESLPLFLLVRRWYEGAALAALGWLTLAAPLSQDYVTRMHQMGWRMTLFLYVPCAFLVTMRRDR